MSNLLIRGKKMICLNCENLYSAEYEGGAQLTQIGDENVEIQKLYNEEYNETNEDLNCSGYYVYMEFSYCEDCLKNKYDNVDQHILFNGNPLSEFITIRDKYVREIEYKKTLEEDEVIKSISIKSLESINKESYDKNIFHKYFKVTFKRKELVGKCIDESKNEILNYIVDGVNNSEKIKLLKEEYKSITDPLKVKIIEMIRQNKDNVYHYEFISSDLDELNPYISGEFTTRILADGEKVYKFYSEGFIYLLKPYF